MYYYWAQPKISINRDLRWYAALLGQVPSGTTSVTGHELHTLLDRLVSAQSIAGGSIGRLVVYLCLEIWGVFHEMKLKIRVSPTENGSEEDDTENTEGAMKYASEKRRIL